MNKNEMYKVGNKTNANALHNNFLRFSTMHSVTMKNKRGPSKWNLFQMVVFKIINCVTDHHIDYF